VLGFSQPDFLGRGQHKRRGGGGRVGSGSGGGEWQCVVVGLDRSNGLDEWEELLARGCCSVASLQDGPGKPPMVDIESG
jgi:hypothetical protein